MQLLVIDGLQLRQNKLLKILFSYSWISVIFLLISSFCFAQPTYHIVKQGETLWRISKNYGVSLQALCEANSLSPNSTIKVGQKLFIPLPSKQMLSPSQQKDQNTPTLLYPPQEHITQEHVVVIDAGHGGKDPGAVGVGGLKEKDVNLQISKLLKEKLTQYLPKSKIYLTRESDIFLSLSARSNFANKLNADLFISIHSNAAYSKYAFGFEVYYLSMEATDSHARAMAALENKVIEEYEGANMSDLVKFILADLAQHRSITESVDLACKINEAVIGELNLAERGVKGAMFYVLRNAVMPAVLVECGFVSNYHDASLLTCNVFLEKLAEAIAKGICNYIKKTNKDIIKQASL